jgi:hypothetical protein
MGSLSGVSACGELQDGDPSWVCSSEGRLVVGLLMLAVLAWPGYAWTRLLNSLWLDRKPSADEEGTHSNTPADVPAFNEPLGLGQQLAVGVAVNGQGRPHSVSVADLAQALWVPPGGRRYMATGGERVAIVWQAIPGDTSTGVVLAIGTPATRGPRNAGIVFFGLSGLAMAVALATFLSLPHVPRFWLYLSYALMALDVALLLLSVRAVILLRRRVTIDLSLRNNDTSSRE